MRDAPLDVAASSKRIVGLLDRLVGATGALSERLRLREEGVEDDRLAGRLTIRTAQPGEKIGSVVVRDAAGALLRVLPALASEDGSFTFENPYGQLEPGTYTVEVQLDSSQMRFVVEEDGSISFPRTVVPAWWRR